MIITKPTTILLSLLFLYWHGDNAIENTGSNAFCGTDQYTAEIHNQYPHLKRAVLEMNEAASSSQHGQLTARSGAPVVLPVVFHIIHDNGLENVSYARIQQELQYLNDAFANQSPYDPTTGVNTEIEFCLAQRAPDGSLTNGVTRTQSDLTDMISELHDDQVKALQNWSPVSYINVWIVREICSQSSGCGVAGYAYLPFAHGRPFDGIVIEAGNVGISPARSGVLIHEMGHYLGLYHTFHAGCLNDDCSTQGDQVCDTPPDRNTAAIPCSSTLNSCNTDMNSGFSTDQDDMIINYMDYGDWDCYSAFTQGQSDRMHYFINNVRQSLLVSKACQTPCYMTLSADFDVQPGNQISVGNQADFINQSVQADRFEWYIDGQLLGTNTNESYVFNTIGAFDAKLLAFNADVNCADSLTQTIDVVCPVHADFGFSEGPVLDVGTQVIFTNLSTQATGYDWFVNGLLVGNMTDLIYDFDQLGEYDVMLVAEYNGANCTDTINQRFTVTCPVIANFEVPAEIDVGEWVGFNNLSSNATSYTWLINGTDAGSSVNLSFNFSEEGIYEVCLEASSGLCTNVQCYNVAIDTVGECEQLGFFKSFGEPGQTERGTLVRPLPDGNILLSMSDQDRTYFIKVTVNGDVIWSRSVDFIPGKVEVVNKIIVDVDGNIVGSGIGGNGNFEAFAFKYDQNFQVNSWTTVFSDDLMAFDIIESKNGDGYYVSMYDHSTVSPGVGNDPIFTKLDKNSGTISIPLIGYNLGSADDFRPLIEHDNAIYTCGRYTIGAAVENMRACITKLDLLGNEIWSKLSFLPVSNTARFYGQDMLIENNQIVALIIGDDDGTFAGYNINFFLQFSDLDGNIVRVVKYDVLGESNEFMDNLISVADGYIIFGALRYSRDDLLVVKVDKQGDLIWAKRLDIGGDVDIRNVLRQKFFVAGDFIYCTADWYNSSSTADAVLLKFDTRDGADHCFNVSPLNMDVSLVPSPVTEDVNLQEYAPSYGPTYSIKNLSPISITEVDECEVICEEKCDNGADDDQDGLIDCDDPDLRDSCCCLIPEILYIGPDTIICDGTVITFASNTTFDTYRWNTDHTGPSINASSAGVYWLEVQDSCGNIQRDSVMLTLNGADIPLDLGPDITICENGIHTFIVDNGFLEYIWHDGSIESSFTAWQAGTYWVQAWDGCRWKSDTVRLIFESPTLEGLKDTTLCTSDTIEIQLTGYDHYVWVPDYVVDCDTCSEVRIATDTAITVVVIAESDVGCIEVDSMIIEFGQVELFDTIRICPGDTILVFGDDVHEAGDYLFSIQNLQGCDTLSSVHVEWFPTDDVQTVIQLCEGDSIWFDDTFIREAGTYSALFANRFGCDSLHTLTVDLLPITYGNDTIDLCPNESTVINGVLVENSGDYTEIWTNRFGCDSILNLHVRVAEISWPEVTIIPADCDRPFAILDVITDHPEDYLIRLDDAPLFDIPNDQSMSSGSHVLQIIDIATFCERDTAFDVATFNVPSVEIDEEYVIEAGGFVTLYPTFTGDINTIVWTPNDGLSCTDCENPIANPVESTSYVIQVFDMNGCTDADTVDIIVVPRCDGALFIPNVFSPNADGINDVFSIDHASSRSQVLSLKVFNRWGGVCYESIGDEHEWDGRTGNKVNINGVYTYVLEVICPDGRYERIAGDVTLMR